MDENGGGEDDDASDNGYWGGSDWWGIDGSIRLWFWPSSTTDEVDREDTDCPLLDSCFVNNVAAVFTRNFCGGRFRNDNY